MNPVNQFGIIHTQFGFEDSRIINEDDPENFEMIKLKGKDNAEAQVLLSSDSPLYGKLQSLSHVPLSQDALLQLASFLGGGVIDIYNLQTAQELCQWAKQSKSTQLLDAISEPLINFFAEQENEAEFDESCIPEPSIFLEVFFSRRLTNRSFCYGQIVISDAEFYRIFNNKNTVRILEYFQKTGVIKNLDIEVANLPEDCDKLFLLGSTLRLQAKEASKLKLYDRAEKCFQKAYTINPENIKPMLSFASILLEHGELLLNLGNAESAEKKFRQAKELYQKACARGFEESESYRGLSEILVNEAFILDFTDRNAALAKLDEAENFAELAYNTRQDPANLHALCNVWITQAEYLQSFDVMSEMALEKFQKVAGQSLIIQKCRPANYDNVDNIARAYHGQAKYFAMIDEEAAQTPYEDAEKHFQSILKPTLATRSDLAQVSLKRAEYLEKRNPHAALLKYAEVEKLGRLIFALDTTDHSILPIWIKALVKTGDGLDLAPKILGLLARRVKEKENQPANQEELERIKKVYSQCTQIQKNNTVLPIVFKKPLKPSLKRRSCSGNLTEPAAKKQKVSEDRTVNKPTNDQKRSF